MLKLEKVKIVQLLNKYDIELDMSDRCLVLIGANGIGKSASLKLVYNIIKRNFADIIAIPFDHVDIVAISDTGKKVNTTLSYIDCLPTKDYFFSKFCMLPRSQFVTGFFRKFLDKLEDNNLYGAFIYCLYKKTELPASIKKLIDYYFDFGASDNFTSLKDSYPIDDIVCLNEGEPFILDILCLNGSAIPESEIYNVSQEISIDAFYFDLVQYYSIKNDIRYRSQFTCYEKEWAYSDISTLNKYKDFKKKIDLTPLNRIYFEVCKDNFIDVFNECKNELLTARCLDINRLINITYFETDLIFQINKMAIDFAGKAYDLYDQLINDKGRRDSFLSNDIINKFSSRDTDIFTYYIRPVLVVNSLFDISLENVIYDYEVKQEARRHFEEYKKSAGIEREDIEYPEDEEDNNNKLFELVKLYFLLEFIKEVYPIVTDEKNKSEKIKKFQVSLQKYLIDRVIDIYPSGLFISFRENEKAECRKAIFDSNTIDLSFLSSGEKKIILLFAIVMFFDETILMDEPELSLSLVWQEQLLPDILEVSGNKFICATHSPYIVNDESVQKYIKYIP